MKSTLDAELVQFEASSNAAGSYSQGKTLRQDGNAALREGDFSKAQECLARAKAQLTEARDKAKPIHEKRMAKENAIALFKKGEWQNGLERAKKADQNDPELLFWIGTCYDKGLGNQRAALAYFILAANRGQLDAQLELGKQYEGRQKFAEAKKWYQKAAVQGNESAMKGLSRLVAFEEETNRRERETEKLKT